MWKALIKLVEKWAYRCEHDWSKEEEVKIYSTEDSKMPHSSKHLFVCKKCMETKIITL